MAREDASWIVEYIFRDNPEATPKLFHQIKDKIDHLPDHPRREGNQGQARWSPQTTTLTYRVTTLEDHGMFDCTTCVQYLMLLIFHLPNVFLREGMSSIS
ncbi:MAG: hypothetical protein CME78_06335 [Halomonas sp.]|nr:hypothetical protein [Halomonas sp.]